MNDPVEQRWAHCKALLGRRIGAEDRSAWLDDLQLQELQPDRVVLGGVPNSFFRTRILRYHRQALLQAVGESFPEVPLQADPHVLVLVGESPGGGRTAVLPAVAQPAIGEGSTRRGEKPVAVGGGELNSRFTLERFVPGANASALRFVQAVAELPGHRFNPLLIVGPSAMGKTHLLQGLAHALRTAEPGSRIVYRSAEGFKNEVLEGISRRRMKPLRETYREADALLLDDLEFLLISPRAQEELLHTFDLLHAAGRQLVFSANRMPAELAGMNEGLRSRLEMGLIAELEPPDPATRRAVVERRAGEEGLVLPPEVSELLARRVSRNLRQVEGAVVRLSAYATLQGQPITAALANEVAAPFFDVDPDTQGPVPADAVLERVADRFGITVRSLRGRQRTPNVVNARRVAIHLLKLLAGLSYSEVGAALGNRTHSTVLHGHRTLQEELGRSSRLRDVVRQLTEHLSRSGR